MSALPGDPRPEVWEQRLNSISGAVPYLLLAAATLLAVLDRSQPGPDRLLTLGLAALAASWMLWMVNLHPEWEQHRRRMALYCAGLLALIAALMTRSPWFGLFAFTGYLHTWRFLHGVWRVLGVTATALLSVTWLAGGFPPANLAAALTYLVFTTVIVILVSLFSSVGEFTARQSRERQAMIAQLAETNRRLEASLAENLGLQAQVLAQARAAGVRDERQRLANEIHDTLAQNLAGIITQLEAAEQAARLANPGSDPTSRAANPDPGPAPAQVQHHLRLASALARESLTEARRSVQALRPAPLERVALPEAIEALAQRWAATTGLAWHFETTGTPQPLLPEIEATLYRVAQEALNNVARHARAGRVGLTLSYMEDVVLLDVRDDGVGFIPSTSRPPAPFPGQDPGQAPAEPASDNGFGLQAMEQRLRRVAGTLEIESRPGAGAAICASVPAIPAVEGG